MSQNSQERRSRGRPRRTTDISKANIAGLEQLINESNEELNKKINTIPISEALQEENDEEDLSSKDYLFTKIHNNDGNFEILTGLDEIIILNIHNDAKPVFTSHRTRGPKPKISDLDSILLYLIAYRTGTEFTKTAALLGVKKQTFRDAIDRIRPILLETLRKKYNNKPRPKLLEGNYKEIALAGDHTTLEVFRPKGRFEEAKHYWDEKNGTYGLKKFVAVSAFTPNIALFIFPGVVGSIHDYNDFKNNYLKLAPYLEKTSDEKRLNSETTKYSIVIMDKGYTGPDSDTPEIFKLTPKKGLLTSVELNRNEELKKKESCLWNVILDV